MIEQPATPAPNASDGSAAARAFGGNSAGAGERLTNVQVSGGSADPVARPDLGARP